MKTKLALVAILASLFLAAGGCAKEEGTMEKMGKKLDEAAEDVEKAAEDAADEVEKAAREATESDGG